MLLSTLVKTDSKKKMNIQARCCFSRIKYMATKRKNAERQSGVESSATDRVKMENIIKSPDKKAIPVCRYFLIQ
jgi:hypothetical protein